jgi:hypothetical protein
VAVNGPLIVDDLEMVTRAAIDGVGLAFMSRSTRRRISQAEHWCAYWKTGASRFLVSFSITPVGGSSQPRYRH